MSEWLQNLGKSSITAGDISDTNYEEFNRLEHDNVKAVNEANDNFIKGLEEQSRASIQFYIQAHANKFNQYKSLADLSKTAATVAPKVLELNESRKQYDKAFNNYITGKVDPEKLKQDEDDKAIDDASVAARKFFGSGAIKADAQTKWDIFTSDGRLTDKLDSVDDSYKLGGVYLENWMETARFEKIPIPAELGGGEASLDDAQANTPLFKYIQKELGIIYLNEARAAGYSDRFLRKYVTKPMFERQQTELNNQEVALGKALAVQQEQAIRQQFYQEIKTNRLTGVVNPKTVQNAINDLIDSSESPMSRALARQIVFGWITDGINDESLEQEDITYIGNEQVQLHGSVTEKEPNGTFLAIKDPKLWGKEYSTISNLVMQKSTDKMNLETRNLQAQQNIIVTTLAKTVQEHGLNSKEGRDAIQLAKTQWNDQFAPAPYPESLNNYIYALDNPIPTNDQIDLLTYNYNNHIPIPEEWIQRLSTPKLRQQWREKAKTIMQTGWQNPAKEKGLEIFETLNKRTPTTYELGNLYRGSEKLFLEGYSESMKSTVGVGTLEERIEAARVAGITKVDANITDLITKDPEHFLKVGMPTEESSKIAIGKNDLLQALQANPGIITSEELVSPNEETLLQSGLRYINGEINTPPLEWQVIAKQSGLGLNAHDLITARLEAVGMLPEGVKAQYSNENGSVSLYEAPGGSYRIVLGAQGGDNTHLEFAEAIGHLQVNADKGGYDYFVEKGKVIKTDIPLSEMTLGEVINKISVRNSDGIITGPKGEVKLGMYDISAGQLLNIGAMLNRNDMAGTYLNRKFNQDLQDELIFLSFKEKLDRNKTLQGASTQEWAQTLNISKELAKELQDVYPMLINTPYLQIKHLLPDVAKALLLELSGTQ